MDGDTRLRARLEARYEWLYRLMVIAAIAVIVVSLVSIASMTGLIPRIGDAKPNSEAVPAKPGTDAVHPVSRTHEQSFSGHEQPATRQSDPRTQLACLPSPYSRDPLNARPGWQPARVRCTNPVIVAGERDGA